MSEPSRILVDSDAAIIKALLAAGWMQSDVASLFQCNGGRIAEVNTGQRFGAVPRADLARPETIAALQKIQTAWLLRVGGLISETVRAAA